MKSAAIFGYLLLSAQGLIFGAELPTGLPEWLGPGPQATGQSVTRLSEGVRLFTYETPASIATVVTTYQEQLRRANVAFTVDSDSFSTTISARTEGAVLYEIRIISADGSSYVGVVYPSEKGGGQSTVESGEK